MPLGENWLGHPRGNQWTNTIRLKHHSRGEGEKERKNVKKKTFPATLFSFFFQSNIPHGTPHCHLPILLFTYRHNSKVHLNTRTVGYLNAWRRDEVPPACPNHFRPLLVYRKFGPRPKQLTTSTTYFYQVEASQSL